MVNSFTVWLGQVTSPVGLVFLIYRVGIVNSLIQKIVQGFMETMHVNCLVQWLACKKHPADCIVIISWLPSHLMLHDLSYSSISYYKIQNHKRKRRKGRKNSQGPFTCLLYLLCACMPSSKSYMGIPRWLSGKKNLPANAGDKGSIPGSGRCPGGGNGNPLQYSCWGNPMDRGPWWAAVHGVANSQIWLSDWVHTHANLPWQPWRFSFKKEFPLALRTFRINCSIQSKATSSGSPRKQQAWQGCHSLAISVQHRVLLTGNLYSRAPHWIGQDLSRSAWWPEGSPCPFCFIPPLSFTGINLPINLLQL